MEATPLYTGLRVRSLDRSIRFYRALGFRPTLRRRTSIGEFVQLEHPVHRFTIELNRFRKGSRAWEVYRNGSEMDHFGFWVDDVDRWVRRLLRVGGAVRFPAFNGSIVIPPRPAFPGRAAYVADPDGIWIELMGPETPGPSRRGRTRPATGDRRAG
jgi:catechol 2,3-dioxygenase-like lactoylglutathione lyase family enzyme